MKGEFNVFMYNFSNSSHVLCCYQCTSRSDILIQCSSQVRLPTFSFTLDLCFVSKAKAIQYLFSERFLLKNGNHSIGRFQHFYKKFACPRLLSSFTQHERCTFHSFPFRSAFNPCKHRLKSFVPSVNTPNKKCVLQYFPKRHHAVRVLYVI